MAITEAAQRNHDALFPDQVSTLKETDPELIEIFDNWAPLRRWSIGPGKKVGIVGMGGLGHMGVKIATAMGAEVTVVTSREAIACCRQASRWRSPPSTR